MQIKAIDFKYTDDIKVISKKQFDVHMNLYKGYINKVNEVTELLNNDGHKKDANATYSNYRGLKKGETYSLDGTILHELYFQNIGGIHKGISHKINEMFYKFFNGYEIWKEDFIACAKSARGWCILAYEQRTRSFRNFCQDTHDEGIIISAFPILVLDMYEHAYYIDYANKKNDYINNFIDNVNWDIVEKRLGNV